MSLCYVGLLSVLFCIENRILFHPVPYTQEWRPAPAELHAEDVWLRGAGGTCVHAWWCPTEGWRPEQGAVLFCHGNACNLSGMADTVRRWQQLLGKAVMIFDYPGYGRSEGAPGEAACCAAGDAAYDWLVTERQVSPERLLIYGTSLGGGVATDLASRHPHQALILVSTFTSIPDMSQSLFPGTPARWLVRNRFDNLRKIARCHQPVFIAHGTADQLIPYAQGERLFAAAHGPKTFFSMPGYDHYMVPGPDLYRALGEFLGTLERK